MLHSHLPELGIYASLHNRENGLAVAVERLGLVKSLKETLKPALGHQQGFLRIVVIRISRAALVEGHHYIGTDNTLRIDIVLRRECMSRPVNMGGERAAVRGQLPDPGQ